MIKLVILISFLGSSVTSNIIDSSYYWKRISPKSVGQRIIGGEDAVIEEYPFAVSLQNNVTIFGHDVEHFCGGSIISDTWIITSAQCALSINVREFHIRAGSTYYYKNGMTYNVEKIVVHPAFNYHNYDFDVGLIKLKRKIVFDKLKQPIKLPEKDQQIKDGVEITIVGWGTTQNLAPMSENLQKTNILKISNEKCTVTYGYQLTDRMFCIISDDSKPCVGDSGSSAVINNTLIGVASWSGACEFSYPTAYTNLSKMIDWIKENTEIS
ncbi:PREDICTED: trypsin-1-like [Polistes canadensis]|uniref:trypsin-1-like n=1 Tax=Polistes canadensis TaxID=91411 RepID=UPI000718B0F9|nr:PREDICTED: trypsin-1-like [Polistes canadensis]